MLALTGLQTFLEKGAVTHGCYGTVDDTPIAVHTARKSGLAGFGSLCFAPCLCCRVALDVMSAMVEDPSPRPLRSYNLCPHNLYLEWRL